MSITYFELLPEDVIIQVIMKLNFEDEESLALKLTKESCIRLLRSRHTDVYKCIQDIGCINLLTTEDYGYIRHFRAMRNISGTFAHGIYEYFFNHFEKTIPPVLSMLILKFNSGNIYDIVINDKILLSNGNNIVYDFISFFRQKRLTQWHPYVLSLIYNIPFVLNAIEYETLYENSLYLLVLMHVSSITKDEKWIKLTSETLTYFTDVIWKS